MVLRDVAEGLVAYLKADADVSAAVGGSRVYPVKLPNGTLPGPSIVYNLISETTDHPMDGPSGLVTARYQLDAWAASFKEVRNLGLSIKAALDGYAGPMGSGETLVTVRGIFAETANPEFDADSQTYRFGRDYFISYDER